MRISEILKPDTTTISAPISPKPPVKPGAPRPISKSAPPVQNVSASIERAVAEARQQLEKDFKDQLEKMKEEARKANEEQLREEEAKSSARNEAIKKEKQQLAAQLEQLRQENDNLKANTQNLKDAKQEISEARAKLVEEFQRKIAELEMERRQQGAKPEAVVPHVKPEISLPKLVPMKPVIEREPPPKVVYNAENTVKARDLYQNFLAKSLTFFERARQKEIETSVIAAPLERFIEEANLHEDLIAVIAEPYAVEQAFIYHAVNSTILALILGNDMKLSYVELRDLGLSTFLHDIGLLDSVEGLSYPRQLSAQMKDEILKHSEKGAGLLSGHVNETVLTVIQQHHELMNGKGYPKAMKGEEIHLFARIISIVDSFEAMTHERPYRPRAMEINQAVQEMIESERGLYDRDVMKVLLARVGLYPVKCLVELSNKQVARVLRQNPQFPLSPMVQVEFDENGTRIATPSIIDLSKNQLVHIMGSVKTTPSYTRERIMERKEKGNPKKDFQLIREAGPLLLMAAVLVLLVYLIIKI